MHLCSYRRPACIPVLKSPYDDDDDDNDNDDDYTGWEKRGHRLITIILSNLNRFTIFLLDDSLVSLQLNGY